MYHLTEQGNNKHNPLPQKSTNNDILTKTKQNMKGTELKYSAL